MLDDIGVDVTELAKIQFTPHIARRSAATAVFHHEDDGKAATIAMLGHQNDAQLPAHVADLRLAAPDFSAIAALDELLPILDQSDVLADAQMETVPSRCLPRPVRRHGKGLRPREHVFPLGCSKNSHSPRMAGPFAKLETRFPPRPSAFSLLARGCAETGSPHAARCAVWRPRGRTLQALRSVESALQRSSSIHPRHHPSCNAACESHSDVGCPSTAFERHGGHRPR